MVGEYCKKVRLLSWKLWKRHTLALNRALLNTVKPKTTNNVSRLYKYWYAIRRPVCFSEIVVYSFQGRNTHVYISVHWNTLWCNCAEEDKHSILFSVFVWCAFLCHLCMGNSISGLQVGGFKSLNRIGPVKLWFILQWSVNLFTSHGNLTIPRTIMA